MTWTAMRLAAQGAEFCAWIAVARRLSPPQVGVLATAALVARYLGLLGDWGAQHVGAGFVASGARSEVEVLVRSRLMMTALVAALFVAGCLVLDRSALAALALIVVARGANLDWISHGAGHYRRAGLPAVIAGVLMMTATLIGSTVDAIALGLGFASLAGFLVGLRLVGPALLSLAGPTTRASRSVRAAVSGSGWILVMSLADQTMASADIILLGWLESSGEAGIYATVYRLPNAMLLLAGLSTGAAVPLLARRFQRTDSTPLPKRRLYRTGMLGGVLVIVVAAPLTFVTPLLFGADYAAGRPALVILFGAGAVITFSAPFRAVHLASSPDRRLGLLFAAGAAANLALNFLLIPLAGMEGAAAATLAVQLVLAVVLVARVPLASGASTVGDANPGAALNR